MRPLRKPQFDRDITPESLAPLYDNVRKLCNMSGTGCTVEETPSGIAIHVPVPSTAAQGFWAIIGDPTVNGAYNASGVCNQQLNDPRCYQWQEAQWINGDTSNNENAQSGTYCKPLANGRSSSTATSTTSGSPKVILSRAREANDSIAVPVGSIVWLEPEQTYAVTVYTSGSTGDSSSQTTTEYVFHYDQAFIRGTLAATLNGGATPDTYGQVNVTLSDDTTAGAGPYNALNPFCESGFVNDFCILIPNPQFATNPLGGKLNVPSTNLSPSYPYIIFRVVGQLATNCIPGYDGNGNWNYATQQFYAAGAAPAASSPTIYATAAAAGSDLQRDNTTTTLSLSSSSITYGQLLNLTATVTPGAGSGSPWTSSVLASRHPGPLPPPGSPIRPPRPA